MHLAKHGIEVSVPEGFDCRVVRSRAARALDDGPGALDAALDWPIGCAPLAELAAGKRTAAISVCDITRPAPNRVTLPPLLKRLHAAGIPVEGVTILIATGLHRAATKEELDAILGPEIAATYRVASHDARDFAAHRALGTTRRGTPVYIDERFMAADLHITLGFVEPHLMLGFSGGRKLIVPGVAAQETIKVIHSPRFNARAAGDRRIDRGNPLHEELLEIAAMARHDFILDVTLTQEREISGVFAGDPVKAHAAAVSFLSSTTLDAARWAGRCRDHQRGRVSAGSDVLPEREGTDGGAAYREAGRQDSDGGRVRRGNWIARVRADAEGRTAGHAEFLEEIRDAKVEVDQWQLEKLALTGTGTRAAVLYAGRYEGGTRQPGRECVWRSG